MEKEPVAETAEFLFVSSPSEGRFKPKESFLSPSVAVDSAPSIRGNIFERSAFEPALVLSFVSAIGARCLEPSAALA